MLFPPATIIILSFFSPLPYNTIVPRRKGMKLGNHGQSWETGGRTGEGMRGVTDKECTEGAALLMSYYIGKATLPAEQHRTRLEGSLRGVMSSCLPQATCGSIWLWREPCIHILYHLLPMDPGHVYVGVTGRFTFVKCAYRYWIAEWLGNLLWWLCNYVLFNNNNYFESVVCQVHSLKGNFIYVRWLILHLSFSMDSAKIAGATDLCPLISL